MFAASRRASPRKALAASRCCPLAAGQGTRCRHDAPGRTLTLTTQSATPPNHGARQPRVFSRSTERRRGLCRPDQLAVMRRRRKSSTARDDPVPPDGAHETIGASNRQVVATWRRPNCLRPWPRCRGTARHPGPQGRRAQKILHLADTCERGPIPMSVTCPPLVSCGACEWYSWVSPYSRRGPSAGADETPAIKDPTDHNTEAAPCPLNRYTRMAVLWPQRRARAGQHRASTSHRTSQDDRQRLVGCC